MVTLSFRVTHSNCFDLLLRLRLGLGLGLRLGLEKSSNLKQVRREDRSLKNTRRKNDENTRKTTEGAAGNLTGDLGALVAAAPRFFLVGWDFLGLATDADDEEKNDEMAEEAGVLLVEEAGVLLVETDFFVVEMR